MSQRNGANSGRFYGKFRGVVTNISDPKYMGRIKFTCPDVFGSANTESAWALPCTNCAYDGGGDIALPLVGETVWVEFEQGNANKPIWVGNFWSSNNTPFGGGGNASSGAVEEDYGNSSRIISYSGCHIVMKNGTVILSNSSSKVTMTGGFCSIEGEVTIDGNAMVTGDVTFEGDATINGKLTVKKSVKASSVTAGGIKATSSVGSDGEISGGKIEADEDIKCKNFEVEENAKINQDLEVVQNTKIGEDLEVTKNVTVTEKLSVTGDTTLGKLSVGSVNCGSCNLV